jgi:hypothetical protein
MGKKEIMTVLPMKPSFDLFNSSSKEPSKTINISPTVPNIGRIEDKSGTLSSKKIAPCLTNQPTVSKRMTEGILVLDELISNTYAKRSSTQIDIIMVVVIWHLFLD